MTPAFDRSSVAIADVRQLQRAFQRNPAAAAAQLEAAQQRCLERRARVPATQFPPELPISAHVEEIRELLAAHRVVIVAGETGSGKTTQLPKICLSAGFGVRGMIGHTQPRRIAARAVSRRIAEELSVPLGEQVGYAVRFSDRTSDATLIKVLTDGLLLAEIGADRDLERYEVLIIDEAHERSLNIDFLLGYAKVLLARRRDLKVIITSATIDVAAFAAHFDAAPVVTVGGRGYPVEIVYRETTDAVDQPEQILAAVAEIERRGHHGAADILTFLSGEREIHETALLLRRELANRYDVLPLYARLPAREQNRIFASGERRRVVLATNVAETSLTVPNIGFVIDPGFARVSRYSYRSKLQRLPIERISQASADQRKGRCGRLAPGLCVRLYSEADYLAQPAYTDPEIRRTNLAAVVLQMRALGLGDVATFPFLDPPDPRAVRDAVTLLVELGALVDDRLTAVGRSMASLPLDPRLARMLLQAAQGGALRELLIIASGLAVQDPRERPYDARAAADAEHLAFADPRSDYLAYLKLWDWYETSRQSLSASALRRACQQRYLSFLRLREWRDLHRQLVLTVKRLGLRVNDAAASYEAIHRAILAGSLSLIGLKDERGEYLGARNLRFRIFPGSALARAQPKWLVSSEISETQRVYARCVAAVEPAWIEAAAEHLVKRSHAEPHWDQRRGETVAFEKVVLFGLPLVERRRVSFKSIDPALAREIFVRGGLVAGAIAGKPPPFLEHNLALVREVRELEARGRRRDLLVGDDVLMSFYLERVPSDVRDFKECERWRRRAEQREPRLLFMTRETVMQSLDANYAATEYPTTLALDGVSFRLRYSFAPGAADDGVSLQVPIGLLPHVRSEPIEWLVPGMLAQKCEALVRALPKSLRRPLAPLPEKIDAVLPHLQRADVFRSGRLERVLGERLEMLFGVHVPLNAWRFDALPPHLRMNAQLRDQRGALIDQDRDVEALLTRQREAIAARIGTERIRSDFELHGLSEFPPQSVPEQHVLDDGSGRLVVYPALEDHGDSVSLVMTATPAEQRRLSRRGYCRAVLLAERTTAKSLLRRIGANRDIGLWFAPLGSAQLLSDTLLRASVWHRFFEGTDLPTTAAAFAARIAERRAGWAAEFGALVELVGSVLQRRSALARALQAATSPAYRDAVADIAAQLDGLVPADFLDGTPWRHLQQLPRYLDAASYRLDNLQGRVGKDAQLAAEVRVFEQRLQRLIERLGERDDLIDLRFEIQELRIALFAQRLGARDKMSAKRLEQTFAPVEAEAGLR
jgi:ATP-dependent RNA helicase HrpA